MTAAEVVLVVAPGDIATLLMMVSAGVSHCRNSHGPCHDSAFADEDIVASKRCSRNVALSFLFLHSGKVATTGRLSAQHS